MYCKSGLVILSISVEGEDEWGGEYAVYLGDVLVGYRRDDGSMRGQVEQEVQQGLAEMLREKLGYEKGPSDG